jgi:hypothetical protein
MTVTGSLALQSGAFYMVQINPATSSFADVTGAATLGGSTVKAIYANGSYIEKQCTILTAGSINGTCASAVETNLPSNFHSTLSSDATHAYLNLVLSFVPPPGTGLSGNQNAIGNAIVNSFNSPASTDCARRSMRTRIRDVSKAATATSRRGQAASASRPMRRHNSPPSPCRPTPNR